MILRSGVRTSMIPFPAWLGCFLSMGSVTAVLAENLDMPVVVTQVPHERNTEPTQAGIGNYIRAEWPLGTRLNLVAPSGEERLLSEGFSAAYDPNVSFDGQRVLFAGRKERTDHTRIWEIGVNGQGLRAISPEYLDARQPIHSATLFTLDSPEPWPATVFVAKEPTLNEIGQPSVSSVYSLRLDGTDLRRLTFNPNRNTDPFQMWDGRVLYAAERFPNCPGGADARVGLYAVHVEGTDMEFYGGERGKRIQQMPCATERGLVVFVESDLPSWDGAGQLGCVEEQRPHVSYRALTKDPDFVFCNPSPLKESQILVARRGSGKGSRWGIYAFDTESGNCRMVFDNAEYDGVQAVLVNRRNRPDGHSTVVDTKFDTGILYGLNCYDTDLSHGVYVQTGAVTRIRVIEGVPHNALSKGKAVPSQRNFVGRRLVGEAPVEADGSFNVEVPADIPLLIQTIDDQGLALANCGWIWLKPREKRGCIGCHEDPERIPENNYVQALRRPSNRLVLPPDQRREISFRETIAPILQRHCATADCHSSGDSPLLMNLGEGDISNNEAEQCYATLLATDNRRASWQRVLSGRYVDPGQARTSPLIWQLLGQNASRPWDHNSVGRKVRQMPPLGKGEPLSSEELRTMIQWIDMGAVYEASAENVSRSTSGRP